MSVPSQLSTLWRKLPHRFRLPVWHVRQATHQQARNARGVAAHCIQRALRPQVARSAAPPSTLLCIYRTRNEAHVHALCESATGAGAMIRLWHLDGGHCPSGLEHWTVGAAPGDRTALLNELVRGIPAGTPDRWIVVADDDVEFRHGGLSMLLGLAAAARLDIAQPAHTSRSHLSYPHTITRPFSLVRRTEFVEVGPVVAFSPAAQAHVFPMDETHVMGLGVDFTWMDLRAAGIELGIVDWVTVRHLHPVAASYQTDHADLDARKLAAGGPSRLRTVHDVWYPTRRRPPW